MEWMPPPHVSRGWPWHPWPRCVQDVATVTAITTKYGFEVLYVLSCLHWTDCTCDQINSFPGLIFDVSQLQVSEGWEHRRLAGLMHDRRVEEQLVKAELLFCLNAWVVLVVDSYLWLQIWNVWWYSMFLVIFQAVTSVWLDLRWIWVVLLHFYWLYYCFICHLIKPKNRVR
jgi:hypothetical protein